MNNDQMIVDRFRKTLPVDLLGMARALGIHVMTQDLKHSGSITRVGKTFVVLINAKDSAQRQRFTLAHMIAHFLLHRHLLKTGVHIDRLFGSQAASNPSDPLQPTHDAQANHQAVELLMPLAQVIKHRDQPLETLAEMFSVSPEAMSIRMKSLREPQKG